MNEDSTQNIGGLVLIVDDDPIIRMLAREALEQAGFEIEETSDGTQALFLFSRVQPASRFAGRFASTRKAGILLF